MSDLVKLLRAAGHNETLASGELYLAAADRIEELEDKERRLDAALKKSATINNRIAGRIEDFILRLESLPRHPAPDQPANMETGKWVQWDALLSVVEDMGDDNGD
jgi:hypothetical protein